MNAEHARTPRTFRRRREILGNSVHFGGMLVYIMTPRLGSDYRSNDARECKLYGKFTK